jgi:hypothetical protein
LWEFRRPGAYVRIVWDQEVFILLPTTINITISHANLPSSIMSVPKKSKTEMLWDLQKMQERIAEEERREEEEAKWIAREEAERKAREEAERKGKEEAEHIKQEHVAEAARKQREAERSAEVEKKQQRELALKNLAVAKWKATEVPVTSVSGSGPTPAEMWHIKKQVAAGHIVVSSFLLLLYSDFFVGFRLRGCGRGSVKVNSIWSV